MNSLKYIPKDNKVYIEYQLSLLTRKLQDTTEFIRKTGDSQWDIELIILNNVLLRLENLRHYKLNLEETLSKQSIECINI